KRVDCKPAKLAQRMHELLQAAVVDVLEQDRAAVEDNVAAEQAAPPRVLEQEREMAARVPGRLDAHDDEIADRNEVAVDELDLDECQLGSSVEQVDVAVVRIGEVEPERAGADEVNTVGELHARLSSSAPLRTSGRRCPRPSTGAPSRRPATSSRSSAGSGRAS